MKERILQHSDERPSTSSRPSLLSEQASEGPATRILGGLDGKADPAPRHGGKKKSGKYGWLAAGAAVLILGAGASTYLGGEGEKEVVLASTAPVSSTPAPAAALASDPGVEEVSTAAILQDVPEPKEEAVSDAEKLGVEDELDKMLAKEAIPEAPAAAVVPAPVPKPAAKPAPRKVAAKPVAKDKKVAAAPVKKKPVAKDKPVQDTDVALLAALVAHTKATQPKRGTAAAKLKQCSTLGSVAEAEDCRAKLCASAARNEAACRSEPVAKATDEA